MTLPPAPVTTDDWSKSGQLEPFLAILNLELKGLLVAMFPPLGPEKYWKCCVFSIKERIMQPRCHHQSVSSVRAEAVDCFCVLLYP